jgi:hypothetical protein
VFVLLLAGCGSEANTLVGKWAGDCHLQGGAFKQVDFSDDGSTVILDGRTGKYSLLDTSRVELVYPSGSITDNFSMSSNTLILSDPVGNSCTLQRLT